MFDEIGIHFVKFNYSIAVYLGNAVESMLELSHQQEQNLLFCRETGQQKAVLDLLLLPESLFDRSLPRQRITNILCLLETICIQLALPGHTNNQVRQLFYSTGVPRPNRKLFGKRVRKGWLELSDCRHTEEQLDILPQLGCLPYRDP